MDDHPDLARLNSRSRSALADGVGVVLDPLILVGVTLVLVALVRSASVLAGLGWAAVTLLFCAVVPEVALRIVMRVQGIGDRQLVVREQRHVPLLVSVLSVVIGVLVLITLRAPATVTALVLTVLVGVGAMTLITRFWKASFHAAVAASMTVVLVSVLGPWVLLPCLPACAAVAWARVRAGRHDLAQVLGGATVGALTAAAVFPAVA